MGLNQTTRMSPFVLSLLVASAGSLALEQRALAMGGSQPKPKPTATSTPKPTPKPTVTPKPSPKPTVTPKPTPTPTPTPTFTSTPGTGAYQDRIEEIAATSACATYKWKSRGRAPAGYMKGMALSFARSLCRLEGSSRFASPALLMSLAVTSNASKDALAHYSSILDSLLRLDITSSGTDPLRALYTLGMGLGMRESSGDYCEGWDTSAGSNRPSNEAEAGIFQTSYNSMGASSELRKLYDEYRANPGRCYLEVFKEGASCKAQSILGTGAGAEFQKFSKECPAFVSEYAMVMLRVLRKHYGPINRKEAEVNRNCSDMLEDVQDFVASDPARACAELL